MRREIVPVGIEYRLATSDDSQQGSPRLIEPGRKIRIRQTQDFDVPILIYKPERKRQVRVSRSKSTQIEGPLNPIIHLARDCVVLVTQAVIYREPGSGAPAVIEEEVMLPKTQPDG